MRTLYKYTATKQAIIAYILLIILAAALACVKWYGDLNENFTFFPDEINSHITNFSISLVFYLATGFPWLLFRAKFRYIVILGVVIIAANFICETLMGFMNTIDIIDAISGSIGTAVAFAFLLIVYKYGLRKVNPDVEISQ